MKYTVFGFNQKILIKHGLNSTDALILRWFIDFKSSSKMSKEIYDDKEYVWVKYSKIIEDLPCIEVSNVKSIQRIFQKFIDCELMKKHIRKNKNGTFSMFYINPEVYDEFVCDEINLITLDKNVQPTGQKCPTPLDKNAQPTGQKCPTPLDKNVQPKDYSISKDKSIKNNKTEDLKSSYILENSIIDYWNLKNKDGIAEPSKPNKSTLTNIKSTINQYSEKELKAAIDVLYQDKWSIEKKHIRLNRLIKPDKRDQNMHMFKGKPDPMDNVPDSVKIKMAELKEKGWNNV